MKSRKKVYLSGCYIYRLCNVWGEHNFSYDFINNFSICKITKYHKTKKKKKTTILSLNTKIYTYVNELIKRMRFPNIGKLLEKINAVHNGKSLCNIF